MGISRAASKSIGENEWWVSDEVTGLSTLYDANGSIVGLTVKPTGGHHRAGQSNRNGRLHDQRQQCKFCVCNAGWNHLVLEFANTASVAGEFMRRVSCDHRDHYG